MSAHARTVSVCLAAHNGHRWIESQLASILAELEPQDDVVVVDDASRDQTAAVVESIEDPRITVVRQEPNAGHVRTFEHALSLAKGDVVMLSDQDDLWQPGRRARLVAALEGADVAVGNYRTFGDAERGPRHPLAPTYDVHPLQNVAGLALGRRSYLGSCMAIRHGFLDVILPFPRGVEAHDHWIAIAASLAGRIVHLDGDPVTLRRLHGGNLTPRSSRPIRHVLRTRAHHLGHALAAISRRARRAGNPS